MEVEGGYGLWSIAGTGETKARARAERTIEIGGGNLQARGGQFDEL